MASPDAFPFRMLSAEHFGCAVLIQLDAANAPVILEGKHGVLSCVRNSAGDFTLNLREGWVAEPGTYFQVRAQTAIDLVPQEVVPASPGVTNVTKANGQTVRVRLLAAAVATDAPAKGANNVLLSALLVLRNTTLTS